jgi:hypothetical protein
MQIEIPAAAEAVPRGLCAAELAVFVINLFNIISLGKYWQVGLRV